MNFGFKKVILLCNNQPAMKRSIFGSAALTFIILLFNNQVSIAETDRPGSVISPEAQKIHIEYIPAGKLLNEAVDLGLKSSKTDGAVRSIVFADNIYEVSITETDRGTFFEVNGEVKYLGSGPSCATLRVIFPVSGTAWKWFRGLSGSVDMKQDYIYCDTISARTILPPDGAFNGRNLSDGGYGDPVGRGTISFYPLCAVSADGKGKAIGIDMQLPLVYRLKASASQGLSAEFDLATSPLTVRFPDRAFFRICRFDFDPAWGMRAALEKYYKIYPESFKKRVSTEGIWLPFTPLRSIPGWEDFGIAFHETSWGSTDIMNGEKTPNIISDRGTGVLSFQYSEPWDLQLPIKMKSLEYDEIIAGGTISKNHRSYLDISAISDKAGKWQMRRLETPWFKTGWAVSITTNCDPDIPGFNKYRYVLKDEIEPALKMDVDGIYFDSMEWNWHHDLNYREDHFASADYPLTFSTNVGRPALWNFASEFKFMKKIADEMHLQGKLAMGNGHALNPFAAANLDLFGAELSWYSSDDHNSEALDFKRSIACQKPIVFLLNEGLNDKAFTEAPYYGYEIYFEKMLAYGFFPSFFSVDASNDPYWQDRKKIENGRPFFKKYIPLIRKLAGAGWEPVTLAGTDAPGIRIERFGGQNDLFFTVRNNGSSDASCTVTVNVTALHLDQGFKAFEMVLENPLRVKAGRIFIDVPAGHTRMIRIEKGK
jgi:hypothetical protein